jgi:hypothetical protein
LRGLTSSTLRQGILRFGDLTGGICVASVYGDASQAGSGQMGISSGERAASGERTGTDLTPVMP